MFFSSEYVGTVVRVVYGLGSGDGESQWAELSCFEGMLRETNDSLLPLKPPRVRSDGVARHKPEMRSA